LFILPFSFLIFNLHDNMAPKTCDSLVASR
jgi:hypothetical protein